MSQNQLGMENNRLGEPFRPGTHKNWESIGCGEMKESLECSQFGWWVEPLTKKEGKKRSHVLRERWKVKFWTLWFSGIWGIQVEMSRIYGALTSYAEHSDWRLIDNKYLRE